MRRDHIDLTLIRHVLQPINWHYFSLWQITSALTVWQQPLLDFKQTQFAFDWQTAMRGAFSYHFGEGVIFACKKPLFVSADDRFRLHNEVGPALEFLDGYKHFAWHGITIAEEIWTNFHLIMPETITHEPNVERRRALIDKYGTARYLTDSDATLVSSDECGDLFRIELKNDEPIVMVRVTNSTPEADGAFKQYFLRVPPDTQTARDGIAWTFGVEAHEYEPQLQT